MSQKHGLPADIDEESPALPASLIVVVLVLELAALACAVLVRFSS
jgi:hypothetical protein